jgi:hypothetical protein
MTWEERDNCATFTRPETPEEEAERKAQARAELVAMFGSEENVDAFMDVMREHPYIKAIERFCNPPWYIRLWNWLSAD